MSQYTIVIQKLNQIITWINSTMANLKSIPDYNSASSLSDADLIAVSQGGVTKKAPMSLIASYVSSLIKLKENPYEDIAEMLADQSNQTEGKLQYVADASDDPEVSSGYAYYEKLSTSTADLSDYRKLSDEEANAIESAENLHRLNLESVSTSINDIVGAGNVEIEFENVGDLVTALQFGPIYSQFLIAFKDKFATTSQYLKIYNVSQNKSHVIKISDYDFTDVSEVCVRIEVTNEIDRSLFTIGDTLEFYISVFDGVETGVSTVTGTLVNNTDPENPVINVPDLADLDTTVTGAELDAIKTKVDGLDQAIILQGVWDASSGSFPGSGTAQAGHAWIVNTDGTVDSVEFKVGDRIIATIDNASTTIYASNWFRERNTSFSQEISGATEKTSIVDTDWIGILDSASSFISKKLSFSNLKASLKTYFDTLYSESLGVVSAGSISGANNIVYTNKFWALQTMTADVTFSDVGLVVDGQTRDMYLTGDFAPTFPAYWTADQDSQTYDGTKIFRLTWDVLDDTVSSEDVRYLLKQITA